MIKNIDEADQAKVRRLSEWSLQMCVRKMKDGYGFCVEGKNKHGQVWHSSAITGRVVCADGPQPRRVISINKSIYYLEGLIDKQLSISSGVASEIVDCFDEGFPDNWVDLMTKASKAYIQANPLTANRSAVQMDDAKEGEEKQDGKQKPKQQTDGVQKRGEGDSHEGNKRTRLHRGDDLCPVLSDVTNQVFYALAFIF